MSTPAVTPNQDFQYIKLPDGSYGKFNGNASDDEIRGHIQKDFPDAFKTAQPTAPAKQPGLLDSLNDSLAFKPGDSNMAIAGKGIGQAPVGVANSVSKTLGGIGSLPSMATIGENDPNDEYGIGKLTELPGTNKSVGLAPYRMGKNLIQGLESGYEARQHEDSLPGKILATMENYPIIGGITRRMEQGQGVAGVTEGMTDAATMKGLASLPKVPKMAAAEGDPGVVYNKYLKPVEHVPIEMPESTPHLQQALINKVKINYPEVAQRIQQGKTTLGDLDIARQVANDSSKAAYTARGLPTQISKGFKNVADSLRDTIYPKIEALHNLPEDSLSELKRIQGDAIDMGKTPKWGMSPTRWPAVATNRLAVRPAMDAFRNLKTRAIDADLPEPQRIDLRSNFPAPKGSNAGITKARAEAARPEFGGEQDIPVKTKSRSVRPAIDVEEDATPALMFRTPKKARAR